MEFKIDAHIHSKYSGDNFMKKCTPGRILHRAVQNGLNGIVVTDARIDIFFDIATTELRNPETNPYGIKLIDYNKTTALFDYEGKTIYLLRGIEHHDDKGHLLEIGGSKPIKYTPSYFLQDRIKCAHDNGNIIGCAHPFETQFGGMGKKKLEELAENLDFIESFNSCSRPRKNKKAKISCQEYNLPGLANSDDHNLNPGRAYTILSIDSKDPKITEREIINSITQKEIDGYCRRYTPLLEKAWVFFGKDLAAGEFKPAIGRMKRALRIK